MVEEAGAHTGSALEIFMEPLTAFNPMAGDVPAIRRGCGKYCQMTQKLEDGDSGTDAMPWCVSIARSE